MIKTVHECGGTILSGGSGDQRHVYCDKCHAFAYGADPTKIPPGTDVASNRAAWDAGDEDSSRARRSFLAGGSRRSDCAT